VIYILSTKNALEYHRGVILLRFFFTPPKSKINSQMLVKLAWV